LKPSIPERLGEVVDRAMAHDPGQRFSCARALAEALAEFTADADLQTLAQRVPLPLPQHEEFADLFATEKTDSLAAAERNAEPQPPKECRRRPRRLVSFKFWAFGALVAAVMLCAVALFYTTGEGVLELQIEGAKDITVKIDGKRREVEISNLPETIRFSLPAGPHRVEVAGHTGQPVTEEFFLYRNGRKQIRARFSPRNVAAETIELTDDQVAAAPPRRPKQGPSAMTGMDPAATYACAFDLGWPLQRRWQVECGKANPWPYPPTVHNGRAYIGNTESGALLAVDTQTGATVWSLRHEDYVLRSPCWHEGLLYCAASYKNNASALLLGIDPEQQRLVWKWTNDVGCRTTLGYSPKPLGDLLVTTTAEKRVGFLGIDLNTGKTAWFSEVGVQDGPYAIGQCAVDSSAEIVVGVLDVTGILYAFDTVTGKEKWRFESGQKWDGCGPVIVEDCVYFGIGQVEKRLYCVNLNTGKKFWETVLCRTRGYNSQLAASQGKILCRTANEELVAVRGDNGEFAWRAPLDPGTGQPLIVGNVVYCTHRGHLEAFELATGRRLGSMRALDGWLAAGPEGLAIRGHETGHVMWFAP
jgi:outer membrane protein assembly factor BamB